MIIFCIIVINTIWNLQIGRDKENLYQTLIDIDWSSVEWDQCKWY